MYKRRMFRTLLFAILCLGTPVLAEIPKNLARAAVETGWREGETHIAGLTIQMAKGWHTYWRSPGAVGIPPAFNWSGSQNVGAVQVRFPVPDVYQDGGATSLVYWDRVTLPLIVRPKDASQPIKLRGEVDIGVCEEICVPVTLKFSATLDASGGRDAKLAAALRDKPETGNAMACDIKPISDGLRMTAETRVTSVSNTAVAVIEIKDQRVWVSSPDVTVSGETVSAEADMVPPNAKPFALARSDVRMTVFSDGRAIEMVGCR